MKYNPLAWLGKLGTFGVAAGIFLGLALPEFAAVFRPWLPWIMFVILALTMARVDLQHLMTIARRPLRIFGTTFAIMIIFPIVVGALLKIFGIWAWWPDLALAIMIMATAPPLLSAPALIYLIGLDGPLAMATLLGCVVVTPITVPVIMSFFAGTALNVTAIELAVQLFVLITGSALVAGLLKYLLGETRIQSNTDSIDGLMIAALFAFAVAFMDGVGPKFISETGLITSLIALAFGLSALFIVIIAAAYWASGRERALTLAIVNGNRSVGLIVAAMAGSIPDLTWTYCALAQFPIYLLPIMLKLVSTKLLAKKPELAGK